MNLGRHIAALCCGLAVAMQASGTTIATNKYQSLTHSLSRAQQVALVRIREGRLADERVAYMVDVEQTLMGQEAQTACVDGPVGLKVGATYLLWSESRAASPRDPACDIAVEAGAVIPRALEVTYEGGIALVRMPDSGWLLPRFRETGAIELTMEDKGDRYSYVLGLRVKLTELLEYVGSLSEAERVAPTSDR